MDVPEPEDLTQGPDDDKELNRDSYLGPTLSRHGESVVGRADGAKSPIHSSSGSLTSAKPQDKLRDELTCFTRFLTVGLC
jgi:hypothetical protein